MNQTDQALSEALLSLVTPSETDIRRATRVVLSVMGDRGGHYTGELLLAVGNEAGAPPSNPRMFVEFAGPPSASALRDDEPVLTSAKARWAGLEAIAELEAQGLIVPANGPTDQQDLRNYELVPGSIGVRHPGGAEGVPVKTFAPAVGEAYRMAHGAGRSQWYLEPTLFMEGLASLGLEERAQRALTEALRSYRRGLYLAAASMLGVVFESAWYSAGRASGPTGKLAEALAQERTARVQELYVERMRGVRGIPLTLPSELLAHAALLRELRNYGVHPAGPVRDDRSPALEGVRLTGPDPSSSDAK